MSNKKNTLPRQQKLTSWCQDDIRYSCQMDVRNDVRIMYVLLKSVRHHNWYHNLYRDDINQMSLKISHMMKITYLTGIRHDIKIYHNLTVFGMSEWHYTSYQEVIRNDIGLRSIYECQNDIIPDIKEMSLKISGRCPI